MWYLHTKFRQKPDAEAKEISKQAGCLLHFTRMKQANQRKAYCFGSVCHRQTEQMQ